MLENEKNISRDLGDELNIDLLELSGVFFRKLHIIILVGVLFAVLTFVGTIKFSSPPQYMSTTKMYVSIKQAEKITYSYRGLDYAELVKSSPVLEKVIDRLELDISTEALKAMIMVEVPQETRVITIRVTHSNPKMAKEIADTVREEAIIRIVQLDEVKSVDLVEEGNISENNLSPANPKRNAILGGFVGCLLVAGIIILKYIFDNTIKTPEDVKKHLGLSVLAVVPFRMKKNKINLGIKDYKTEEAFKTLRTNIMLTEMNHRVILVTSCTPNERKNEIFISLAKSVTESGKRVLMIDADLREPVFVGKGVADEGIKGLSHLLSGVAGTDEVIRNTQQEKLDVVMVGAVPENPAELLEQDRFEEFVNSMKKVYDYIIINTPPLGSVIDAAIVARVCDGVVWALSAGKISYKFARVIKNQIEKTKCPLLGVVLDDVDRNYDKYYSKYYGEYGKTGKVEK